MVLCLKGLPGEPGLDGQNGVRGDQVDISYKLCLFTFTYKMFALTFLGSTRSQRPERKERRAS